MAFVERTVRDRTDTRSRFSPISHNRDPPLIDGPIMRCGIRGLVFDLLFDFPHDVLNLFRALFEALRNFVGHIEEVGRGRTPPR